MVYVEFHKTKTEMHHEQKLMVEIIPKTELGGTLAVDSIWIP